MLAEHDPLTHPPAPQPVPIPSLLEADQFTDDRGVTWKRRGGGLSAHDLARMIGDPKVTVLHEYLGKLREVPLADRRAFWAEAEDRMRRSPYSGFFGQEFKSEDRRYLVVIAETC